MNKIYSGGFRALNDVSLSISEGEIFALLGPNGAGKTTLISMICGLVNKTSGSIAVNGESIDDNPMALRRLIGLVPQELTTDMFETVWDTVSFSRGLFGLPDNPDYIETLLKNLSLWDKKNNKLIALSGGMKRRTLIAKALSHEPRILFLDEPTAGVDVELRKDMWTQIRELRESGVTIILTTHYIEEAEEMADRIGIINQGSVVLVKEKQHLMEKLGNKQLIFYLQESLSSIPESLAPFSLTLDGDQLYYDYSSKTEETNVPELMDALKETQIVFKDIQTKQRSLEDIFVGLLNESR